MVETDFMTVPPWDLYQKSHVRQILFAGRCSAQRKA